MKKTLLLVLTFFASFPSLAKLTLEQTTVYEKALTKTYVIPVMLSYKDIKSYTWSSKGKHRITVCGEVSEEIFNGYQPFFVLIINGKAEIAHIHSNEEPSLFSPAYMHQICKGVA